MERNMTLRKTAVAAILALGFVLPNLAQPKAADSADTSSAGDQNNERGPGYGNGPGMMMWGRGANGGGMMWGRGGFGPGPGMMAWMFGPGDDGARIDYVEGRLAFVKAELKITPQQTTLWDKFATTVRANAKTINERRARFMDRHYWATPLPERLDQQEKAMAAHLDALRQTNASLKPLYAALDDAQKKTADALLGGPMMGALGMM
jgi:hypothetical protein